MSQLSLTMKELFFVLQDDMDVIFLNAQGKELFSGHTPFTEIPEILKDEKADHLKMDSTTRKLIVFCK